MPLTEKKHIHNYCVPLFTRKQLELTQSFIEASGMNASVNQDQDQAAAARVTHFLCCLTRETQ